MDNEWSRADFAKIERGIITEANGNQYIVTSYGRYPMKTPAIAPLRDGDSFAVGDSVFFFLFDDGDGRILGTF